MTSAFLKSIAAILICSVWLFKIHGQDIIYLSNGEEIESKITEISETEIKYKKYTYLDGPSYVINADKVFMLVFENGTKEVINPIRKQSANQRKETDPNKNHLQYHIGDTVIYFNSSFMPASVIGFHTVKPLVQIEILKNGERILVKKDEIFRNYESYKRSIKLSPEYCCNGQSLKTGDRVIVHFKNSLRTGVITLLHPQLNFTEIILSGEHKKRTFRFGSILPMPKQYQVATGARAGDNVIYFDNVFKSGTVQKISDYNLTIKRYYRVNGIEYSEVNNVSKLKAIIPIL